MFFCSKWSLYLSFTKNCLLFFSHTRYLPLSHSFGFDENNDILWGVNFIKLSIMKFSQAASYFPSRKFTHICQYPTFEKLSRCTSINLRDQDSYPCKRASVILIWHIWYLHFYVTNRKTKDSELNGSRNLWNLNCWTSHVRFWFVDVVIRVFNFAHDKAFIALLCAVILSWSQINTHK